MNRFHLFYGALFLLFSLHSCVPASKLYYFNDLKPGTQQLDSVKQFAVKKIKAGDRLYIVVSSADPTLTAFLNPFANQNLGANNSQFAGYLVDKDGNINFPLLGSVVAQGYSTKELAENIRTKLTFYYKEPFVYVNLPGRVFFINGRSGTTIEINNERLTVLEAIAQSGVQDSYDKKNQLWLIREDSAKRTFVQLDMNKKNFFESPYYYLHNNDVLYMKPGKFSFLSSGSPTRTALTFAGVALSLFLAIRQLQQ